MENTVGCFFCNGILGLDEDGEIEVIDKYNFEDEAMTDRQGNPVEICDDCMIKLSINHECDSDISPLEMVEYEVDASIIQLGWIN